MSLLSDLRVLYHIVAKPVRGKDHAARLESFYSGQAEAYDDFRRRLLQGREAMYRSIPVPEGGVWVDLGGGTGANLEPIGAELHKARKVYLVDLCDSLLAVARKRCEARGWKNVEAVDRRRDDLPARRRPGRRGDLFLLADDDPRLVCRDRQRPGDVAAGRDDRRDRLLRRAEVSGRGPHAGTPGSRGPSGPPGSARTTSSCRRITFPICSGTSARCGWKRSGRRCPTCR